MLLFDTHLLAPPWTPSQLTYPNGQSAFLTHTASFSDIQGPLEPT
jgi:hypothetical protein